MPTISHKTSDSALPTPKLIPSPENTELLYTLNPAMGAAAAKVEADFPKTGPARRQLLTILRSPRYNIVVAGPTDWNPQSLKQDNFTDIDAFDHNDNDKNWWCPLEIDRQLGALRAGADAVLGTSELARVRQQRLQLVYDPAMHLAIDGNRDAILKAHPIVKSADWRELDALAAMPSAPRKLAQAAIRWGKASKGGDGAPEALALAVRTTRYGCNWHGSHAAYSSAAQKLLQKKFKDTPWARQTPYWFGCQRQEDSASHNAATVCEPKTWPKQAPLK